MNAVVLSVVVMLVLSVDIHQHIADFFEQPG